MMVLKASRISKHYGHNAVLRDVTFSVRQNEVLGLIGPNGSGKTTLFECLAGLIAMDSGELVFAGVSGDGRLPPARCKEKLFYLPDGIRPWADQTVRWVLQFFEGLFARLPRAAAPSWPDLARALQVEHLFRVRIGSLSKGESKRVLLALGLLTPQPVLLLDEPFDGLDFRQTRDAMSLLRTHCAQGRTLFLSIHQLTDAERVCDRLVLLSNGAVAGEGTTEELRALAGLAHGGAESAGLEEIFLALT